MKNSAFTLIEILIALVILAIAMTAVLFAINHEIRAAQQLQNKTLALIVADNAIAEMKLAELSPAGETKQSGRAEMLGQVFRWQARPDQSGNNSSQRIKISVTGANATAPIAVLYGFVGSP